MSSSAYDPHEPARRPGGKPDEQPKYRVLVHRRFKRLYEQLADRVGLQQAQQFWDHVSHDPGNPAPVASTCILRGKAGKPQGPGWSRTTHYEVSGAARIDYQFNDEYRVEADGDAHRVVAILTINYSSH
ncbi:hypothetical protein ABH931_005489 [Streptacidiphilus sp. MAP12-33]|uniref:hypothetical protein n=1 Tax=Streptacidiphilus sp. MAP12-33 TaxID=3156266 RepID=UPI003519B8B0